MKDSQIVNHAIEENRRFLMEHESKDLISEYDIPVGKYKLVQNVDQAINFANRIGYPVVAKVMSPDIIHKTEAGIIKLNIKTDEELRIAFEEITTNAKKYKKDVRIEGINIQNMAIEGLLEVIIGGIRDQNFGPVLMFGLGGIFVEIFKDVSYRVCPINRREAARMITKIKAFPLMNGYRGKAKADIESIITCLVNCCQIFKDNPNIKELDLNPVIIFEEGKDIMVVDARIILREGI
ncbi:MAG: acetyl-CoA synthetase [Candidatus Lokiarchaeota archaeon]|nr:acetyl-CoA synthetase [Candidatus Lokiarchaeota archaeon]MBD3198495.1 acetyl-CoA synthetase [Candidatus Lokiarchaeota archaeon]